MLRNILRKSRGCFVFAMLATIPVLLVMAFSDRIIQESGVHTLSALRIAACALLSAALALLIIRLIACTARAIKEKKERERAARELEEEMNRKADEEKSEQAKLNVREPLKDSVIYARLKSWLNEDWGRLYGTGIPELISDILRQMDDMNMYQAKLSRLIANNGADYLEDTNAVLESVEQCILRKVRKILNCFVVYESSRPEDVEKILNLLTETRDSNEAQLNNVKEFLLAITDFLNRQGEDNTGIERLNIYKKTILESASEDE